jgi:hypothetical protein
MAVLHKYIGLHDLYVPEIYARDMGFGMTNGSITDGFIETYFPGDEPLPDAECCSHPKWSLKRLWVGFFDRDQIPEPNRTTGMTIILDARLRFSQAYHVVGIQYGLTHQDQPDNPDKIHKVHNEFWIERKSGKLVSFIECDGDAPYPRCTHYFNDHTFSYHVRFAKIYLPEWRLIHDNVIALMGSFKSEEAARAFLSARTSKTKTAKEGKMP